MIKNRRRGQAIYQDVIRDAVEEVYGWFAQKLSKEKVNFKGKMNDGLWRKVF